MAGVNLLKESSVEGVDETTMRNKSKSGRAWIRIDAPFWLVTKCMDIEQKSYDPGDFDFEDDYEFEWRNLQGLKEVGPGLLVEVEDEGTRILVWIG